MRRSRAGRGRHHCRRCPPRNRGSPPGSRGRRTVPLGCVPGRILGRGGPPRDATTATPRRGRAPRRPHSRGGSSHPRADSKRVQAGGHRRPAEQPACRPGQRYHPQRRETPLWWCAGHCGGCAARRSPTDSYSGTPTRTDPLPPAETSPWPDQADPVRRSAWEASARCLCPPGMSPGKPGFCRRPRATYATTAGPALVAARVSAAPGRVPRRLLRPPAPAGPTGVTGD